MPLKRRIIRSITLALAALVLLCALLVGVFSVVLSRVPEYRTQAQAWIDRRTGLDIEFATLRARWRWYGPELVFDDAVVRTADRKRTLAVAHSGGLGFDLWTAIRTGRLKAGRLFLDGTELRIVRTQDGRIEFVGQDALLDFNPDEPFDADALPTGRLHVSNARVSFRDLKTGRGPWTVQGAEFDLQRGSNTMQLVGSASLPKALGKYLKFFASSNGRLNDPQSLAWTFKIEGNDIDLAGWADVMPNHWFVPETGSGSLMLSGKLSGLNLEYASGQFDFSQVTLVAPTWTTPLPRPGVLMNPDAPQVDEATTPAATGTESDSAETHEVLSSSSELVGYTRLAAKIHIRHSTAGWHTEIDNLELARAKSVWKPSTAQVDFVRTEGGGYRAKGKVSLVVLENVWPLLAYVPESERMALLRSLRASGEVHDFVGEFSRADATAAPQYSFAAKVNSLSVAAVGNTPGVAGLVAVVQGNEHGGSLELDSRDVSLHIPRLFRTPLPVDLLQGAMKWSLNDGAFDMSMDELRIQNVDGRALAKVKVSIPKAGAAPIVDLTARAEDLHAAAAPRYMPAGILPAKLLDWLDHAFPDGHVSVADLTLRGDLRSFPFRHGGGLFLIRAKIDGLTLNYQPGWSPAINVTANAEFRNQGLTVRASAGTLNGLHMERVVARFKDFKDSELEINGAASGHLHEGLGYLQQSPIGPVIGDLFQNLQGSGALQADVELLLPIKDLTRRKVFVRSRLQDAQVALKGVEGSADAVNGQLTVEDTAVRAVKLSGVWLGGAVNVGSDDSGPNTTITARGHFLSGELSRALKLPSWINLDGSADWRGLINFPDSRKSAAKPLVVVDSDLVGVGIRLPAPMDKPTGVARALHLEVATETNGVLLRGSVGDLRALVRLTNGTQGWNLDRGTLRLDSGVASLPDHAGMRIEGNIDRFVLDDWLHVNSAGDSPAANTGRPLSSILRAANVRIGTFSLFGYSWSDVRGLLQATEKAWRIDVSGNEASGQVTVPYRLDGPLPIGLDMERLVLKTRSNSAGDAAAAKSTDPRDIPSLRVHIGDLTLADRHLGAVELQADRVSNGVKFPAIRVNSAALSGQASGEWLMEGDTPKSSFVADLESSDLKQALHDLNYGDFATAKRASLHAELSWPGGINDQFLAHATGRLALQVDDGQLLSVQPGAGRVLGLFSISDLRRRLALDFTDLTEPGLSFDNIHGDFDVTDGNAYTRNLLLRGPAAEIGIAGRMGFGARDYDQTAVVTGNLGVSLPVAGALAGGPVVGAALLVFSQLFKEPLKGVTRGYYRITGPWENPTVERVDAAGVKQAASHSAQEETAVEAAREPSHSPSKE